MQGILGQASVTAERSGEGKTMNIKLTGIVTMALLAPAPVSAQSRQTDRQAIERVLAQYVHAVEKLDVTGTEKLFAADSQIFESGGSEGSYAHYLAHHLRPEFKEFKSFKFSDYKVSVRFEGPLALATETYRFRIEPKEGDPADRLGVATSVLRKTGGQWKIISMHNSARKPTTKRRVNG